MKRFRSGPAEAEIIGLLLMTVVVVAGFSLMWLLLYPRYASWSEELARSQAEGEAILGERVVLEALNATGGVAELYLLNTGDVELRVSSIYVNDSLAWSGDAPLKAGEELVFTVAAARGRVYRVRVCSARGNCWDFLESPGPWSSLGG